MQECYTLADLQSWESTGGDIDPPIRLGIFGDPVAHSLSPQMQNAALTSRGLKMQYARFRIAAELPGVADRDAAEAILERPSRAQHDRRDHRK